MPTDDMVQLFKQVELFDGLTEAQIKQLASISEQKLYKNDETVFNQGEVGDRIYIVRSGFVEIIVGGSDTQNKPRTIVNLGAGQLFGEMALVDRGARSATVRSVDDKTLIHSIQRSDFTDLCEADSALGYTVMRNMAADLSFKLRHRNLAGTD